MVGYFHPIHRPILLVYQCLPSRRPAFLLHLFLTSLHYSAIECIAIKCWWFWPGTGHNKQMTGVNTSKARQHFKVVIVTGDSYLQSGTVYLLIRGCSGFRFVCKINTWGNAVKPHLCGTSITPPFDEPAEYTRLTWRLPIGDTHVKTQPHRKTDRRMHSCTVCTRTRGGDRRILRDTQSGKLKFELIRSLCLLKVAL